MGLSNIIINYFHLYSHNNFYYNIKNILITYFISKQFYTGINFIFIIKIFAKKICLEKFFMQILYHWDLKSKN